MSIEVKLIDDDLWDHYSGLPSPLWYQQIKEIEDEEEEDTSDNISNTNVD